MKKEITAGWLVWAGCLIVSAVLGIFLPVTRNACFWVAVLGIVMVLVLCAFTLSGCAGRPDSRSIVMSMPLPRMVIGVLLLQLVVGFAFMALAYVCPWVVAAVVECLVLTVDAAALSRADDGEEKDTRDGDVE